MGHTRQKRYYFWGMQKVKTPQTFTDLFVVDTADKGRSVAKTPDGQVVFLEGAVPGDIVDVRTTRKKKNFFEGVVTSLKTPSPHRTTPKCMHFGVCGGCKWQNMSYERQLYFKEKEVAQNIERIGHTQPLNTLPIAGCATPYGYRNKMEFSFSAQRWLTDDEIKQSEEITDREALGFHIPGMWDKILDLKECHLQPEPSNSIRLAVKEYALKNGLTFYHVRQQTGLLRSLMIRNNQAGAVMVLFQFFEDNQGQIKGLFDYLLGAFPQIESAMYTINQKANDSLYDCELVCYNGQDHILETMEGLSFKIQAKSFYQTNPAQAYTLYKIARSMAGLTGTEVVYDLYTGTGTIAQFVAKSAKKVIGIESVADAVADAKANALRNKIDNVHFFVGDMKSLLTDEFVAEHGTCDVLITDPPRAGMHPDVVAQILAMGPEKIVYVSCNSATQARDIELLSPKYRLITSQSVDMFPQTHHVENVVLLTKIAE